MATPNTIDLQIQTAASDGKHTPRECVQMAKEQELRVIAITDHDTVAGVEEALRAGAEFEVRVIPGIEISVEEEGAHILAYGFDYQSDELGRAVKRFVEERISRAKKIMENLKRNEGFLVEWQDILKEAGSASTITSPHIVYAVMKRPENREKLARDGVNVKQKFYERYLAEGGPNNVRREHFSAKQAIELIHKLGGVAIWSHPAIHFKKDCEGLENFLKELISWGIDGLEVFSPSHNEDDVEFLEGLKAKYNLLRTAGSDFHEAGDHPSDKETGLHSARSVGDYETYGFSTEDIVFKLDEAVEKVARLKPPAVVQE